MDAGLHFQIEATVIALIASVLAILLFVSTDVTVIRNTIILSKVDAKLFIIGMYLSTSF
jgi:uncharacterized Tic20 family protein